MRTDGRRRSDAEHARRSVVVAAVVSLSLVPLVTAPSYGSSVEQGRELYRVYCRSCHGEGARGDGPTAAALKVRPPDLTTLARENDGEFPAERVHDAIDGRPGLLSHGTREMPVWGKRFRRAKNSEAQAMADVLSLTKYLESIQK